MNYEKISSYTMNVEFDIEKLVKNKKVYKSGLVHDIYLFSDYILKVPKEQFEEFHTEKHSLIEKKSLELLQKNGIPTPKVYTTQIIEVEGEERPVLVEEYIDGTQKNEDSLSQKELEEILNYISKIHQINLEGFGDMGPGGTGKFQSWVEYINNVTDSAIDYIQQRNIINKAPLVKAKEIIADNLDLIRYQGTPSLVTTDLNVGNIFFNRKNEIISIIDIDHPVCGDPLFEYACLKFYNSRLFSSYRKRTNLGEKEKDKILIYEIVKGLSVVHWRGRNGLDTEHRGEQVSRLIKDYAGVNDYN